MLKAVWNGVMLAESDAAWHYPQPKDPAKQIQGYVAFWHGVEVKR